MLVHFDCGTVQHKGCLIDYILLDQIRQYILPYACPCPCTKSAVHTLPGAKPFGQIQPGDTCIQPVYHCIEHFPVAFAWTASLRLSFWWKQIFHPFPLRFTQFMSFHVLKFTTLAFCTPASGFKTGSRVYPKSVVSRISPFCGTLAQVQYGIRNSNRYVINFSCPYG